MQNGLIGIIPECKIRRTTPRQYNIEKHQDNNIFKDYDSKQEPFKINGETIKIKINY